MRKLLLTVAACAALLVVGCGGDDNESDTAAATTAKQEAAGAPKRTAAVSMKEIQFQPATVTVAKGGTVTWTNDDSVPHDVTKQGGPGKEFRSGTGNLQQGDTYEQTFTQAGTVDYVCTVHPGMAGKVVVK
ncbi:MAG: plastocyanin/azurin family copper-binding protein [Nocardioidaceae bacterium]